MKTLWSGKSFVQDVLNVHEDGKKLRSWMYREEVQVWRKSQLTLILSIKKGQLSHDWLLLGTKYGQTFCSILKPNEIDDKLLKSPYSFSPSNIFTFDPQGASWLWFCPVYGPSWCCKCQTWAGWICSSWTGVDCCICWRKQEEAFRNEAKRTFKVILASVKFPFFFALLMLLEFSSYMFSCADNVSYYF